MTTVKIETMESLKGTKFAELKTMAKESGWDNYCNGLEFIPATIARYKAFIGITKNQLIEYIADIAQIESDLKMMEEMDAEEEFLDGKISLTEYKEIVQPDPTPETPSTDLITLKVVASMLGITEKSLRRKLRQKGAVKPGGRWEWAANHPYIETIKSWKGEA